MKKILKNIIVFLLVCCFSFVLAGCDDDYTTAKYYEGRVQTIELIEYENTKAKRGNVWTSFFGFNKNPSFDEDKCTVIETLSPEYHEEFVSKFFEVQAFHGKYISDSPSGQGIRITCKDGSFTVFTWGYVDGKALGHASCYDKKGKWQDMQTGFESLRSVALFVAAQYFETEIKID
ncbi:MAG: hypothetical protein IKD47_05630 [Clostridia bacterium]|nr:hypothetical protein [Clostridia bacterium]